MTSVGQSAEASGEAELPTRARSRRRCVLAIALALLALPVFVDLAASGSERAFDYVAADAFYYLTVARNIAEHGRVSFDQTYPTNGYHPAWQFLLAGLYALGIAGGLAPHHILTLSVLLGVVLLGFALVWLGGAMARGGGLSPLFTSLPLGAYAILASSMWWYLGNEGLARERATEGTPPLYGTLWSYANGMESSLLLAAFGATVLWYVKRSPLERPSHALVLGQLLALVVLSRLDHVFFAGVALAALLGRALRLRRNEVWRCTLLTALSFALPLAVYLAVNRVFFGTFVPVSGSLKTSFPRLSHDNLNAIPALWTAIRAHERWLHLGVRLAQTLIPLAAALLHLLGSLRFEAGASSLRIRLRRPENRFEQALLVTAPGVIALALYNLLFVPFGGQGPWYYPVSTLYVSLLAVRVLDRTPFSRRIAADRRAFCTATGAIAILTLTCFTALHRTPDYHARYADFYFREAPLVRAHYGQHPPRLFEFDDGIVAFSLGYPTMSGMALVADSAAVRHARAGTLGNLAVERGFRHFTSLVYYDLSQLGPSPRPRRIAAWMKHRFRLQHPGRYRITMDYLSPRGGFAIAHVAPRGDP